MNTFLRCSAWAAPVVVTLIATLLAAADELPFEEEAAIRSAVAAVAPCTVRIEPAGVSEAALGPGAEANPASGPSTGIVVEPGWVLATAFAVPKDVGEAIVVLPVSATGGEAAGSPTVGARHVARVVGRDLSRGLVLLQMDDTAAAAMAEWVPRGELAVGQWSIAVGRAWDLAEPSVAVGVISAMNRSWGRSVQTDASVSPANYGGPLVDIAGRVIGILAPLPADTAGMNLGTELYDSGIGFAVPMEDVIRVLPRLKRGESLAPGVLGIGYASRDPFTAAATVATCRAGSPAAKAGLRPGDTIVSADGRPVTRIAELRHVLAPRYAGDMIEVVVERAAKKGGGAAAGEPQRITMQVELVKELPPWRRPALGIVPERAAGRDNSKGPVRVAWVWGGSPAARAGIEAGDLVEAVVPAVGDAESAGDEIVVDSPAALAGIVAGAEPGRALGVVISREGQRRTIPVEAAVLPADLPNDFAEQVPPFAPQQAVPAAPGGDAVVIERLEAAEVAKPPLVVLPAVAAREPLGVLVSIEPPRGDVEEQQAVAWKRVAARHGVAVILPGSADPQRWGREDIGGIKRALATLASKRAIDPARVAIAGQGAGGGFAWLVADALGPVVRGVAMIDAGLPRQASVEPVEPGRSRWVLFGSAGGEQPARVDVDRRRLEQAGLTVGTIPGDQGPAAVNSLLAAWVEALGVL